MCKDVCPGDKLNSLPKAPQNKPRLVDSSILMDLFPLWVRMLIQHEDSSSNR